MRKGGGGEETGKKDGVWKDSEGERIWKKGRGYVKRIK